MKATFPAGQVLKRQNAMVYNASGVLKLSLINVMTLYKLTYLNKHGQRADYCTVYFANRDKADEWLSEFDRPKAIYGEITSYNIALSGIGIQCIGSFKLE